MAENINYDWRNEANCRDKDPELFFPTYQSDTEQIKTAKKVCGACTVQIVCLQYALENGVNEGIWGGMTEGERRVARRRDRNKNKRAEVGEVLPPSVY